MCEVYWYSVADGSWGSCDCHDLLVIKASDLTSVESALLDEACDAGDDHAIITVLSEVQNRTRTNA